MSSIEILNDFKRQLITFLDELIDQFPSEGDIIVARVFLKDQIPITEVMSYFIRDILPLKEYIISKNEAFFVSNNVLFGVLDKNKVNHFKRLWKSDRLDSDDKNVIWAWFNIFVTLAERYQRAMSS